MNKYNNLFSAFLLISIVFMNACGQIEEALDDGGLEINNPEAMAELRQLVEQKFSPEKEVFELKIYAKDHLSNDLERISIGYLDQGLQYSQNYYVELGLESNKLEDPKAASKSFQRPFFLKKLQGKVKIKDFKLEDIPGKFEEAIQLIPQEYEGFVLNDWEFKVNNQNEITAEFLVEGTKKGEGSSRQGRTIVTSYYQFKFKMDNTGKLTLKG
ncbi:MAG TPA: hypothetical protein DCS93_26690 [Microscillaceae bacterium]|nr:hypothetical protein [Microscillaceae bacterium]